ncbi:hypothetical protein [uncultured Flavobacterium sp.]|uniref:hypothetical protein n=1 Tax=uncultured Flavobacterium sp. TaxID=165435 RepID=UPI0030EE8C42
MKWKFLAKTATFLMALLNISEIPVNAENNVVDFTAEQDEKLKAHLGDVKLEDLKKAFNNELIAMKDNEQMDLKAIQDEIDALVKESNLSAEEIAKIAKNEKGETGMLETLQAIKADQQKTNEMVKKLIAEDIGDSPEAIIKNEFNKSMKHSETHLHASGKDWDAFDKRPWNARLRDGGVKATDFMTDSKIPLLQDDLEHFVRENPTQLDSLFNDFEDLPKQWSRTTGVLDRIANGAFLAAEIVQGRKKGWSPKNKFKIAAEQRQVFRKKIDITFEGYELQEIENTWIRNYNREGSSPFKTTFIGYLLGELVKRQKLDDRVAQINGIFVESPEGDGNPGANVNSQNGLRYLWWYHRFVTEKYKPFSVSYGLPTKANIVDYIREMIESIPEEDRNQQGMEIQMSTQLEAWYRERAGKEYQLQYNTDQGMMQYTKNHPIDYPNFIFQPLKDQTKSLFIGITKSSNVDILDYNANEKSKFVTQQDKRDTNIFADYRLGIGFKYVGVKLAEGDPAEFERQMIWSNDAPIFDKSITAPLFDDETGIIKLTFNNMTVDKTFNTDITSIEGAVPGMVIKITGNTGLASAKAVKKNTKIVIGSDFALNNGGTLTLLVKEDGTFMQVSRTTEPAGPITNNVNYDTAVIDANEGNVFTYSGDADLAVTSIINGVEGKTIKIYGTDLVDIEVTMVTGEGISLTAALSLGTAADYIELMLVDGVWVEIKRVVA